jgi:hypothetical protein
MIYPLLLFLALMHICQTETRHCLIRSTHLVYIMKTDTKPKEWRHYHQGSRQQVDKYILILCWNKSDIEFNKGIFD